MRFKKTLLFSLFFAVLSLLFSYSSAWAIPMLPNEPIKFTPNIPIPGSETFGGGEVVFDEHSESILAIYIRDLYNYGAGLAGVVALFMLVFAGWKWLFAAGSSEKISAAKSVVNNVLIGLLLLFGGYLLLSQISERLVNLRGLVVPAPGVLPEEEQYCAKYDSDFSVALSGPPGSPTCGRVYNNTTNERGITCLGNICSDNLTCVKSGDREEPCPYAVDAYENAPSCVCAEAACLTMGNTCSSYNIDTCGSCYGQVVSSGNIFTTACYWDFPAARCVPLHQRGCETDDECFFDSDGDGRSEICCGGGGFATGDRCNVRCPGS